MLLEVKETYAMIPVQLVDVPLDIKTLVAFFDSGSNISIIWTGWAEKAGLEGVPVTRKVYTAGGDCKEWKTKIYILSITKADGSIL